MKLREIKEDLYQHYLYNLLGRSFFELDQIARLMIAFRKWRVNEGSRLI
jgi:hypothetical protein